MVKAMILRLTSEREELRVLGDQYGCPTYAGDLAAAILHIAHQIEKHDQTYWGTYYYFGQGITTWHGFAEKICKTAWKYHPLRIKLMSAIPMEHILLERRGRPVRHWIAPRRRGASVFLRGPGSIVSMTCSEQCFATDLPLFENP
jgi:hypothetical protein